MRLAALLLLLAMPTFVGATTLSVVPFAKALQNPAFDTKEDTTGAREALLAMLVNQPATPAELERFKLRLAQLVRHRDTRLGKLFFKALESTPEVSNLPADATELLLICERPLALGASVAVFVRWRLIEAGWRIAEIEVNLHGAAAATVVNCAPYFGDGMVRPELLNLSELDYLVGRDAADRIKPASEQKPFTFDDGLARCLAMEEGALTQAITAMQDALKPSTDPEDRLAGIAKYLRPEDEKALREADADPKLAKIAYENLQKVLTKAAAGPGVSAIPARTAGRIELSIMDRNGASLVRLHAGRKADGQVAFQGEWREAREESKEDDATSD